MKWHNLLIISLTFLIACNDSPYMQGKRLYTAQCSNCHMEDGSGLVGLIPPLSSSKYLGEFSMACILKQGIRDTIRKDSAYLAKEMPSFKHLSATEVTNIVNYVNHQWHQPFKEMSILDAEKVLASCKQ